MRPGPSRRRRGHPVMMALAVLTLGGCAGVSSPADVEVIVDRDYKAWSNADAILHSLGAGPKHPCKCAAQLAAETQALARFQADIADLHTSSDAAESDLDMLRNRLAVIASHVLPADAADGLFISGRVLDIDAIAQASPG